MCVILRIWVLSLWPGKQVCPVHTDQSQRTSVRVKFWLCKLVTLIPAHNTFIFFISLCNQALLSQRTIKPHVICSCQLLCITLYRTDTRPTPSLGGRPHSWFICTSLSDLLPQCDLKTLYTCLFCRLICCCCCATVMAGSKGRRLRTERVLRTADTLREIFCVLREMKLHICHNLYCPFEAQHLVYSDDW